MVDVESLTDFPGDQVASAHRNKGRGHGRCPVHCTRLSQPNSRTGKAGLAARFPETRQLTGGKEGLSHVVDPVTNPRAAKHQAEMGPRPLAGR